MIGNTISPIPVATLAGRRFISKPRTEVNRTSLNLRSTLGVTLGSRNASISRVWNFINVTRLTFTSITVRTAIRTYAPRQDYKVSYKTM